MNSFCNQNILKLVFTSLSMFSIKQLLDVTHNHTIVISMLKTLNYDSIFRSMGRCKIVIEGHEAAISSLLLLPNNILVSGSWNGEIKLWDLSTYECIKSIDQKSSVRLILHMPNSNIATCSLNGHIKVWDPSLDYECIKSIYIEGYTYFKKYIQLPDNNLLCSVYNDNELLSYVLVLDYNNDYNIIKPIPHNNEEASCFVYLFNNKFASGSSEGTIRLWDIGDNYNNCKTFTGHHRWIYCLQFNKRDGLMYSGSDDMTIKVWNSYNDYTCIKTIENNDLGGIIRMLLLPNGYIVTGSSQIKIWNKNYECINEFKGDAQLVISFLFLNDYRLVSTSNESNVITIWEY
jgi:WD40 repeat protein